MFRFFAPNSDSFHSKYDVFCRHVFDLCLLIKACLVDVLSKGFGISKKKSYSQFSAFRNNFVGNHLPCFLKFHRFCGRLTRKTR